MSSKVLLTNITSYFQALKLVSLSVSTGSQRHTEQGNILDLRDSTLWFPDVPEPHLTLLGVQKIPSSDQDQGLPLSVVIFAGIGGQDWQHISGITVLILDDEVLVAIEVSLSDGCTPVRIGLDTTDAETERFDFEIDGPGGERITAIDASYTTEPRFVGFRVRTTISPLKSYP